MAEPEICILKEDPIGNYDDSEIPFHYLAKKNKNEYPEDKKDKIKATYLISVVIWLVLIYVCEFYKTDWIGYLILFIPILVFAISFSNIDYHTVELENEMFGGNFLSFVFLITALIISWSKINEKKKILKVLIISIVLIMGSLIDVWVKIEDMILVKHIRTIFQTTALALLIYALYSHYSENLFSIKKSEMEAKNKLIIGV